MRRLVVPLLLLLCAGCVGLPENGRVQEVAGRSTPVLDEGFPYAPRPPRPGESRDEIVSHFLDAMTANPITTSVARQFLAEEARGSWNPEARMITYTDASTPTGSSTVEVELRGANHLDAAGSWQGRLPEAEATIEFPMTREDGEWRIVRAPDAMIVPSSWFDQRYRRASLYFFDPTGRILVPEQVFVPRGGQLATALMRGLIRGPGNSLRGVSRSFFPNGLSLDLSAPVSATGVAEVALQGDVSTAGSEALDLMIVQIAWTLRQDPSVQRVRVTVGDSPITGSGTGSDFAVGIGQIYDPSGVYAWEDMFGLREGRLVSSIDGRESRVRGPFGRRDHGLRDVSFDLPADQVAGVTQAGDRVLLARVDDGQRGSVRTVHSGATDLLHPAWDHAGRLWLLDRRPQGAVVTVWADGVSRRVRVPGVTGEEVVDFLVSRDGSRLVAALDRPRSDVVVVSRLVHEGRRIRATPARAVLRGAGDPLDLSDLGWRSPTEAAALNRPIANLSEVRTFSVDGSPVVGSGDTTTELVRDDIVRLVGAPNEELPFWVVPDEGTVFQLPPEREAGVPLFGIEALTYVG